MANETGTKSRLIEIATELFAEHGVHKVSFQQIASRLSITQAALYKHFDDKDDVLLECAKKAWQSKNAFLERALKGVSGNAARLRTYLRAQFEWQMHYADQAVILLLSSALVSTTAQARGLASQMPSATIQFFVQEFREGAKRGEWVATRFENKARVLHSLLEGELLKALRNPSELSPERRGSLVWMSFVRNLDANTGMQPAMRATDKTI